MTPCSKRLQQPINADICTNTPVKGYDEVAWIFNYDDIASISYNASNPNIVNGLTLKETTVVGSTLTTGNLVVGKTYKIIALATAGYYGAALVVGSVFVAQEATAINASNTVAEVTGDNSAIGWAIEMAGAENPFTGTKTEGEKKPSGFVFNNTVMFPVLRDSAESAKIVNILSRGKFFMLMKKIGTGVAGESKYRLVGLQAGLKIEAAANDAYGDNANGGWEITLKEPSVIKFALFLLSDSGLSQTEEMVQSLIS